MAQTKKRAPSPGALAARGPIVTTLAMLTVVGGVFSGSRAVAQGLDMPTGVTVSKRYSFGTEGGEVQSTVVPPGKNAACPDGKLLISNDHAKNPAEISRFNLNNPGKPSKTIPQEPPGFGNYRRILSNDHDIVTLPNGDVLLLKMGQTKAPLHPEPAWFDAAYKIRDIKDDDGNVVGTQFWGPGARSEILVWRSQDCGHSKTVSEITVLLHRANRNAVAFRPLPQPRQQFEAFTLMP